MLSIKHLLPRGLFGRAALILVVPVVTIQLIVSTAFIQRYFDGVTRQLTTGVALDLAYVLKEFSRGSNPQEALLLAQQVAEPLEITLLYPPSAAAPSENVIDFYDVPGRAIVRTMEEHLPELIAADVSGDDRIVHLRLATQFGALEAEVSRRRMSAANPHQLLVIQLVASILMTLVAYIFLRNQLRPIARLAEASEAFGRGEKLPFRPRGALEVRAAGRAFLEMRGRIERQIEQRTLMLSGVSHDLRTPLTRMKLALAFLPEDEDTKGLQSDVAQMERLVNEFLAFVSDDATELDEEVDLSELLEELVFDARRGGGDVTLMPILGAKRQVNLRGQALRRAVENLVSNGLRYGKKVEVYLSYRDADVLIAVEDDGPGIPADQREEAMQPFSRLGAERDPNKGGGVGLGLAIAADMALSHGGILRLHESTRLGGLKAVLSLAR